MLATAVVYGASRRVRIVEAEVMAASAYWLRLGRRLQPDAALLGQLSLGRDDGEPALVMLAQYPTCSRPEDERQPPVAADEAGNRVHVPSVPQLLR